MELLLTRRATRPLYSLDAAIRGGPKKRIAVEDSGPRIPED